MNEIFFNEGIDKGVLIYLTEPIGVRFDCKAGVVKAASDGQMIGDHLVLDIMAAKTYKNVSLFPQYYEPQDWLQVIGVDSKRRVISFLIRGRSLSSFNKLYADSLAEEYQLSTKKIKASFVQHNGEKGTYYSVKFEIYGESELVEAKDKFISGLSSTSGLYLVKPEYAPEHVIENSPDNLQKRVQLIRGPVENGID